MKTSELPSQEKAEASKSQTRLWAVLCRRVQPCSLGSFVQEQPGPTANTEFSPCQTYTALQKYSSYDNVQIIGTLVLYSVRIYTADLAVCPY